MKKTGGSGGKGHTSKHAGTHKHHARGSKHHPRRQHLTAEGRQDLRQAAHTKAKHPHHVRGLAVGDLLPVCTFEALAMSLRLAGQRVAEDDLMELWWLSGAREVSIAEALDAAVRFGLAGVRPVFAERPHQALRGRRMQVHGDFEVGQQCETLPGFRADVVTEAGHVELDSVHALILGVNLPGPHAVLATPDGWWSWGTLYDRSAFPHARIEEAWAVSWA